MNCSYFGKCGSCTLYDKTYEEQLTYKYDREKERFSKLIPQDLSMDIIKSEESNFRNRAEFRIWKNFISQDKNEIPTISYAMNDLDRNTLEIDNCSIVSKNIATLMPKLLAAIQKNSILLTKLFSCEFLNATSGDMLITLIYHRKLDEQWIGEAQKLERELNINIIGRSRKQKVILSKDYIQDTFEVNSTPFTFHYFEGGFTQPNTKVNAKMIQWVLNNIQAGGNLCELYCGGGNFTIPLSTQFDKVLATEISKTSIKAAKINCDLNSVSNIEFIRMSSEEFVEALNDVREFRRLKDVDLKSYHLNEESTIFVDPPRAGLDDTTRNLSQRFKQIIYISCNPETLYRDLETLTKTHEIKHFAIFDQFAYTNHIECGVVLTQI